MIGRSWFEKNGWKTTVSEKTEDGWKISVSRSVRKRTAATTVVHLLKALLWVILGGAILAAQSLLSHLQSVHPALFGVYGGNVEILMMDAIALYAYMMTWRGIFRELYPLFPRDGTILNSATLSMLAMWLPCFTLGWLIAWPITNFVGGHFHTLWQFYMLYI